MKGKKLAPLVILAVFLAGWQLGRGGQKPEQNSADVPVAAAIVTASPAPTATPVPTATPSPEPTVDRTFKIKNGAVAVNQDDTFEVDYVLNTNTHKFHKPTCSSVDQMKDKNKLEFTGTREEVIAMGYEPCGRCNP